MWWKFAGKERQEKEKEKQEERGRGVIGESQVEEGYPLGRAYRKKKGVSNKGSGKSPGNLEPIACEK